MRMIKKRHKMNYTARETWLNEAVLPPPVFIILGNNRTGDEANERNTALSTNEMKKRLDQREQIIATRYARTILLPWWGEKFSSG